ncbi:MAG: type II toxin-antitoxin system prevent-host-death family antitoxin, partial [Treponema sp.]|nr:type II toxin-antitoxin system prevent-host-death family antitoxin [Treponema sp.]
MCRTSIYEARNNFSALVKLAEEGEVVELTRYDKPVAVIISYAE